MSLYKKQVGFSHVISLFRQIYKTSALSTHKTKEMLSYITVMVIEMFKINAMLL